VHAKSGEDGRGYLKSLPAARRVALKAVREVIRKNLPKGYQEGMSYGMIGYFVPLSLYPNGYWGKKDVPLPFAALASQKQHMSIYLFCNYADPAEHETFIEDRNKSGKKLDMGKSCVRFKRLEDVALPAIGRAIRRVKVQDAIRMYESMRAPSKSKRA
jgi:hypothetical protein